jgi:hypothetical protein
VEHAIAAVQRLATLKRLRTEAAEAKVPAAFFNIDREVSQLERGLRAKTAEGQAANNVLRRAMEKTQADEAARMRALRLDAMKARLAAAEAKAKAASERRALDEKKAAKAELQQKLEALPKEFNSADCVGTAAKAVKTRANLLERLQLRSPPLSFEEQARWPRVRDRVAVQYGVKYGVLAGERILEHVRDVIKKLGGHIADGKGDVAGGLGDPSAFHAYFAMLDKWAKDTQPCGTITL